jgi:hypothetical protein
MMSTPSQEYRIELKPRQHEWLARAAEEHGLADPSKAVRCLVNFAIEHAELQPDIFDTIRCEDCG